MTFCLRTKESDRRATMAGNIAEVRLKNINIVFVGYEAVIFEILKTCVFLAMAYLLVIRPCFFAICTVKDLPQFF